MSEFLEETFEEEQFCWKICEKADWYMNIKRNCSYEKGLEFLKEELADEKFYYVKPTFIAVRTTLNLPEAFGEERIEGGFMFTAYVKFEDERCKEGVKAEITQYVAPWSELEEEFDCLTEDWKDMEIDDISDYQFAIVEAIVEEMSLQSVDSVAEIFQKQLMRRGLKSEKFLSEES